MLHFPSETLNQYKVPLVGDTNAGKTSIVSRYTNEYLVADCAPTVGVSTVNLTFDVQGKKIDLNVWDTAGQEKFRSLVPLYTRHASIMILVFDISNSTAFAGLDDWIIRIRNDMGVSCPILVCGNKIDLSEVVSRDAVKDWASKNGCVPCFTSAVNGEGVSELFNQAVKLLIANPNLQTLRQSQEVEIASETSCC
jgi:small GTP-binding protein